MQMEKGLYSFRRVKKTWNKNKKDFYPKCVRIHYNTARISFKPPHCRNVIRFFHLIFTWNKGHPPFISSLSLSYRVLLFHGYFFVVVDRKKNNNFDVWCWIYCGIGAKFFFFADDGSQKIYKNTWRALWLILLILLFFVVGNRRRKTSWFIQLASWWYLLLRRIVFHAGACRVCIISNIVVKIECCFVSCHWPGCRSSVTIFWLVSLITSYNIIVFIFMSHHLISALLSKKALYSVRWLFLRIMFWLFFPPSI
jgi:hypothetical protein